MRKILSGVISAAFVLSVALFAQTQNVAAASLPKVQRNGAALQLMVDGKPWIALAGEVHNSTASGAQYMAPVWDHLKQLHLNTVISPVYWELVEPQEGRFDFALVDAQIALARKHQMRLVLLWFGTLKNAMSSYPPMWVRADTARFPRVAVRPGSKPPMFKGDPAISVFGDAMLAADSKAFGALMAHIARVDPQHTVIAMQVENETGMIGDSRDRSVAAEAAWAKPVPPALLAYLSANKAHLSPSLDKVWARNGYRQSGTWAEVFGTDWQADEIFMAWGIGRFVDKVAAAGKARLNLPMYVNTLVGPDQPGQQAGDYPSGGPVPRVADIWHAVAPHIDWRSPDIYFNYAYWAPQYSLPDNLMFIPETKFVVGDLLTTLGEYNGAGFSPFGIEDGLPDNEMSQAYDLLSGMLPLLADAQAHGTVHGVTLAPNEKREITIGAYRIALADSSAAMPMPMGPPPGMQGMPPPMKPSAPEQKPQSSGTGMTLAFSDTRPMGLILQTGPDEFLVLGRNLELNFALANDSTHRAEIGQIAEGRFVGGRWVTQRVMNGDERTNPLPDDRIGLIKIKLLRVTP